MKKIISILAILACFGANAQVFPPQPTPAAGSVTRGGYGTYTSIGYASSGILSTIVSGTVTPVSTDTLKSPAINSTGNNTDTGYISFSCSSIENKTFDVWFQVLSGTLSGAAVLQGSIDGLIWNTITGSTTYCSGCIGASATVTGAGTTHYQWYVPTTAENYKYHQVRAILSGTCTATFGGQQIIGY